MYSRSIRSSIPSHSRGSVFRFTRLRPFCESALLKEESTHEDRSLGSADLFHVALALDNVLCLFIDLAAGREITESLHLVAISSERFFDSIGERNEALILAKANSYQFARNFPEFTRKKNFISKQSEKIEIQRIPTVYSLFRLALFFSFPPLQDSLASSFDETKSVATTVVSPFVSSARRSESLFKRSRSEPSSSSHGVCIDGTIISHYHRPRGVLGPRKRSDRA